MTPASYAAHLQRSNTDSLGFIPLSRLQRYEERGQVLLGYENGDPAGFLVFGSGHPTLRIYQAAVDYQARRREHGRALVDRLVVEAQRRGCDRLSLWCGDDLEANDFWKAIGFTHITTRPGGKRRGRALRLWTRPVATDQLQLGF